MDDATQVFHDELKILLSDMRATARAEGEHKAAYNDAADGLEKVLVRNCVIEGKA